MLVHSILIEYMSSPVLTFRCVWIRPDTTVCNLICFFVQEVCASALLLPPPLFSSKFTFRLSSSQIRSATVSKLARRTNPTSKAGANFGSLNPPHRFGDSFQTGEANESDVKSGSEFWIIKSCSQIRKQFPNLRGKRIRRQKRERILDH